MSSDVDDIIERTIKRVRMHEQQEVSVSTFGSEHWAHLAKVAGLCMASAFELPSIGIVAAEPFLWSDEQEPKQADRCGME